MQTITHLVIEVPASKLRELFQRKIQEAQALVLTLNSKAEKIQEAREIYRDCLGSTPGGLPSPRQVLVGQVKMLEERIEAWTFLSDHLIADANYRLAPAELGLFNTGFHTGVLSPLPDLGILAA